MSTPTVECVRCDAPLIERDAEITDKPLCGDCWIAVYHQPEGHGHSHNWRFDGDDPYVVCDCGARRDALTGRSL